MTGKRRQKKSRQRGHHTHGWGAKKKHRGAGNRGGRGRAGSGKRADQKKPSLWKDLKSARGFGHRSRILEAIKISDLVDRLPRLEKKGAAKKSGDVYEIDISLLGKQKLLGRTNPTIKLRIKAQAASSSSVKVIEESGGEVLLEGAEADK